jgi:hypothetical protein
MWLAELYTLKATVAIINFTSTTKLNALEGECFFNINFLDLEDLIKKTKEKEIVDKLTYLWNDKLLEQLEKIFKLLANACYCSMIVENWTALQNSIKLAYNFIVFYSMTPFNHWKRNIYEHLTMIVLCFITMLKKIRENGYYEFRQRYQQKLAEKELALI